MLPCTTASTANTANATTANATTANATTAKHNSNFYKRHRNPSIVATTRMTTMIRPTRTRPTRTRPTATTMYTITMLPFIIVIMVVVYGTTNPSSLSHVHAWRQCDQIIQQSSLLKVTDYGVSSTMTVILIQQGDPRLIVIQ